jgi:outer membrane protein OmpA-like peptidoglycan-associated protein
MGGESYNQDLSERRADTIKKYLTDKYASSAPTS